MADPLLEPASSEEAERPSEPSFVLGVDLDGVVVDFYGALRPIAAEWLGVDLGDLTPDVTWGLPEWNIDPMGGYTRLHRFAVTQRRLFAEAPPIPGAPAALRRLSYAGIRIRIITNRLFISRFHREAVQQTIEWLDRHDVPYWDFCLMKNKAAVGANLYIDDGPENVEALRAKGLNTIVFTNSTNRELDGPRANDWLEAERLVLDAFETWQHDPADHRKPAGH